MTFSYAWLNADTLGIVKKSWVTNDGPTTIRMTVLDGMQNILPPGITRRFQNEYSTLGDGYKKNERIPGTTLALFSMSSLPTDKAEPNEALSTTTVWSAGLDDPVILLSSRQLREFRRHGSVTPEPETRGVRGAYFVCTHLEIEANEERCWYLVAEVNQDHAAVARLIQWLNANPNPGQFVEEEVKHSNENLKKLVGASDGFQVTADVANDFRHCSNTVFNILRGGIPLNNYLVERDDFLNYLQDTYQPLAAHYAEKLKKLPERVSIQRLKALGVDDNDYRKLCLEYLPLTFGRRHGDPSRPWNFFSIDIKDEEGKRIYHYQGNWRDIFQNWEALAISFPEFLEGMIAKFVNASSADGYNPYRVFKTGFEWEELNPEDEWSNIGYWGDHQIIYLLRLLEMSCHYHPGKIKNWLNEAIFTYANIPYRIKAYPQLIENPHDTIEYDFELDA
ncbi:MAG: hypothetical protein D6732_03295, partial [Methanobacteriota archaeon]